MSEDRNAEEIKRAQKNKLLKSILSREDDEFTSTYAISQLMAFYMQNVKKQSSLLNFGVINMSNIVQSPNSMVKFFVEKYKKCYTSKKTDEVSIIQQGHDTFNIKVQSFLDNFERLMNNRPALEGLLGQFEGQFDECHNLRNRARKWVEINRLQFVEKQGVYDQEFFQDINLHDGELSEFISKVFEIESELEESMLLENEGERVGKSQDDSLGYLKDLISKGVVKKSKRLNEIMVDSQSDKEDNFNIDEDFVESFEIDGLGNKRDGYQSSSRLTKRDGSFKSEVIDIQDREAENSDNVEKRIKLSGDNNNKNGGMALEDSQKGLSSLEMMKLAALRREQNQNLQNHNQYSNVNLHDNTHQSSVKNQVLDITNEVEIKKEPKISTAAHVVSAEKSNIAVRYDSLKDVRQKVNEHNERLDFGNRTNSQIKIQDSDDDIDDVDETSHFPQIKQGQGVQAKIKRRKFL